MTNVEFLVERCLGGGFLSGIGAEANASGRVEVFGIGADNRVWHARKIGSTAAWSGWAPL